MATKDENLIYSNDWFADRQGREWSVQYVDVEGKKVRLRSLDPPEKTVTLADLRKNFKLSGSRGLRLKVK